MKQYAQTVKLKARHPMTEMKSDEQIIKSLFEYPHKQTDREKFVATQSYRQAEFEILPKLNALEKENEELKAEVERLKAGVDYWTDKANYAEKEKGDYQALRTRFDNMVRGLRELKVGTADGCQFYTHSDIQSIIAKYEKEA